MLTLTPSFGASGINLDNHIRNDNVKNIVPGANPTVDSTYKKKLDNFQNVEKEIYELKIMFQEKEQALDEKMEKMQAMMDYQQKKIDSHQTKLDTQEKRLEYQQKKLDDQRTKLDIQEKKRDYQQEKIGQMENEIDNLKQTVSSQSQMIDDLKNSKAEVKKEMKSKIHQQEEEIRSLKQDTELLVNIVKDMDAVDEQSQGEHSQRKTSSETVDNIGVLNDTITDKQNIMTMKTFGNKESVEQSQKINNFKGNLSKRKSVVETRMTKRQITGEIAFSAYLSHDIPHLAPGHTLKCDQIIINDGNAYSPYTGVFTVPTTGVYLLTFNFDVYHSNRWEAIKLVVNNRNIVDAVATGFTGNNMGGNTAIIKLIQGETVWLESYGSNDGEVFSTTAYKRTTFSGVLLY